MAEPKIDEPQVSPSNSFSPVPTLERQETSIIRDGYKQLAHAVLRVALFMAALAAVHHYSAPVAAQGAPQPPNDLQKQVHDLTAQVEQLKQEQGIPAPVLTRYRKSVGYIFGVYRVGFANQHPAVRARATGTGFLVGNGLVATNRHVAEPWFGDTEAEALIQSGASATLERLVVFFPGSAAPVKLSPAAISTTSDLAILRTESTDVVQGLPIFPLAEAICSPGQLVTVMGYPMGVVGMVAKSPPRIYERLAYRHNDISAASELAALSLIRPSVTYGHLGDVVGDKLIYDAPTAHGGSGGPVLNAKGEVIGVNFAYMDGFSGATLGISVESLRPLLKQAQKGR